MNITALEITTKEKQMKINLPPLFTAFSELFTYLKKELSIEKDFDIYVKTGNDEEGSRLLTESNFKADYTELKQSLVKLLISENPNLDSQIKTIITEYEHTSIEMPKKEIEGLSVFGSGSKIIESKWINNDEINSKPVKLFSDKCSCCTKELSSLKFICWICDNGVLCETCEASHDHPVIKYKSLLFSKGIDEMINYKTVKENKLLNMFKKDIELTSTVNYAIITQLKKPVTIPIQIKWNGNHNEAYTVIIKNYKDLLVKYDLEELNKKEEVSNLNITFTPKLFPQAKYDIGIFINLKDSNKNSNTLSISLEVKEDPEDEALNDYFSNYPQITLLPKKHKQLIEMTFKEKVSGKTINEIYAILKFHKWNIESAIEDLTQENIN